LYVSDLVNMSNGLNVSNNTSLIGTLRVSDNVSIMNGLNVNGLTTLNNMSIAGNVSIGSITGTIDINSPATFNQGINVISGGIISNNITANGTLYYNNIQAIGSYQTFENVGIFTLNDYNTSSSDQLTLVNNSANATLKGTGTTSIYNNLDISSSTIQMVGTGIGKGIDYTGPFNISGPMNISTIGNSNNFNYNGNINLNMSGPFNLSTTGTSNTIKYGGDVYLYGDLRIQSGYNLIIEGSDTITQLNTSIKVTEILNVTNEGTGPALIINQIDTVSNDIAYFQDNSLNVFTIQDSGNTTIKGSLKIGYPMIGFGGGSFSTVNNAALDISGSCSISKDLLVVGNITSYSDERIKTNIQPIQGCLDKIKNISGYKYNRTDLETNETHIGLIAQEVEKNFPELITETNNIKGINYQGFIAILLNCIKELNEKIKSL